MRSERNQDQAWTPVGSTSGPTSLDGSRTTGPELAKLNSVIMRTAYWLTHRTSASLSSGDRMTLRSDSIKTARALDEGASIEVDRCKFGEICCLDDIAEAISMSIGGSSSRPRRPSRFRNQRPSLIQWCGSCSLITDLFIASRRGAACSAQRSAGSNAANRMAMQSMKHSSPRSSLACPVTRFGSIPAPGGTAPLCFVRSSERPSGLGSSLKGALQESAPWRLGAGTARSGFANG
jgi:hypothetical protein